ncbi:NADPH-dependent FMN reductase [Alkalihalobacillus pseudalcaliphilus]|uniref:NADPH-dependent FMN reductase n=1 Tax=Alkalihalobacillus pseudalcaliphilus TaxID=79884 RepID=UPI00064DE98A|nr:NAD(P)H-dependent oxidoreductase [Alkalihalobacillus pseudalcaliphilus]KMK75803.1 hypothetical protein AB990_11075 [Alkalihalobacillus pseudalcaliphilus]
MKTIAVICGSLRKGSYNKKLVQRMKDSASEQLKLVEVRIEQIPLYNFDVEVEGIPDSNGLSY